MKLRRYRLIIEDAGRLHRVWGVRISRVRLVATIVACVLVSMAIGAAIAYFTPMKRRLPGFITYSEREQVISALTRLDTLSLVVASNQAFMANVMELMDTKRTPTDSLEATARLNPLPLDSLKTASPAEREFVAMMEQRDKYNLNVLTPVAADAVFFADPTDGGVVYKDTRNARQLLIIMPSGVGVNAIADGYVVDRAYDASAGTYTLMVQSKRGFLTRYSHLGAPLVDKGDAVLAGQRITLAPEKKMVRNKYVGIEMWREGTPLIPGQYVMRHDIEGPADISAPRGR